MLRIENLTVARQIRDQFLEQDKQRFERLNKTKRSSKSFTTIMQNAQETSIDKLIPVNPNEIFSAPVNVILNGTLPLQNINYLKQMQLLAALKNSDWENAIFRDQYLIETVMALFTKEKISQFQFETLWERYQASQSQMSLTNYKLITYQILDSNNEYTEDAKRILLGNLDAPKGEDSHIYEKKYGFMDQEYDNDKIQSFKWLMQAFTEHCPSENCFYTVDLMRIEKLSDGLGRQLSQRKLSATLHDTRTTCRKIYLSATARMVIRLACFGLENMMSSHMIVGEVSKQQIEEEHVNGFHPRSGFYPGQAFSNEIHGFHDLPLQTRTDHDHYHVDHFSKQGHLIRNMFWYSAKVIRRDLLAIESKLKIQAYPSLFSKNVWQLVDADFKLFNVSSITPSTSIKTLIGKFCTALDESAERGNSLYYRYDSKNRSYSITDSGIVCFIEISHSKNVFVDELKFDPAYLIDHYKRDFDITNSLTSEFTKDVIYNILLFRLKQFFELRLAANKKIFIFSKKSLDEHYPEYKDNFICTRDNLTNFLGIVDTNLKMSVYKNILLIMLSIIGVSYTFPKVVNNEILNKQEDLLLIYLILNLHAKQFKFMQKNILTPIHNYIQSLIENKESNPIFKIQEVMTHLKNFIIYHKNSDKKCLPSEALEQLQLAVVLLNNYSAKHLNFAGMKAGFLK